jgi:hypothetical protein
MTDDRLDEQLRDLTSGYHQPPETPREAMWVAIQRERVIRRAEKRPIWKPVIWGGLAAAALIALGVMIGRWTQFTGQPEAPSVASNPTRPAESSGRAYKIAAVQYLGETEEFLTVFRSDLREGQVDRSAPQRARQLLSVNRLLMDSPAGEDPKINQLLQDLELVLAEIARVSDGSAASREEAGFIDDGLEQGGLMDRLRTAVPAGQPGIGL